MTSIATINFQDLDVVVYGTEDEPLIKCSDLIIHVLGYEDCSKTNWFKKLRQDPYYVTPVNHGGGQTQQFFTEQGAYKALMLSRKPVAEEFQKKVCDLLKSIRLKQKHELEETKRQLEYYQSLKKIGYIYRIQHRRKTHKFYVGLTEQPDIGMRFKDHKKSALSCLKLPLYREIFKEGLKHYDILELEKVEYVDYDELKAREDFWIDSLKAPLNNGFGFKCVCGLERKQHHAFKLHKKSCEKYQQFKLSMQ